MLKVDLKKFKVITTQEKSLFLFYGVTNFLITNSILQLFLLLTPIYLATIISQITNLLIGFYLYGKKVFKLNNLTYKELGKYILLASFNWMFNYLLIRLMHENGINKNLAAILNIPFLVIVSFYFQKKYIFVKSL